MHKFKSRIYRFLLVLDAFGAQFVPSLSEESQFFVLGWWRSFLGQFSLLPLH